MREILTIVLAVLFFSVYGQQISVESFSKLENDLTARTKRIDDQNGEPCAIIKVVVSGDGFSFQGDGLGIVDTEHKTGEYWVYVPHGAKYLTVLHNVQGELRQYAYPEKIESLCTYRLKLSLSKIVLDGNYLKVNVNPPNAEVYIDDGKIDSDITPFLLSGTHTYRVVLEKYTTQTGTFEINKAQKKDLYVKLERSHGYVNISYKPDGAQISVDGEKTGRTTPATFYLESGKHTIVVKKDMYESRVETINVYENCNINLTGNLPKSATATLNITANVNYAIVYIDEVYRGLVGRNYEVGVGNHTVRIERDGYKDDVVHVKVISDTKKQQNIRNLEIVRAGETKNVIGHLTKTRNNLTKTQPNLSRGYRGFCEFGVGIDLDYGFGTFATATIHGCQILPKLFVGGGWGYYYSSPKDVIDILAFTDARFDMDKKYSPFVEGRLGSLGSYGGLYLYLEVVGGFRIHKVNFSLGALYVVDMPPAILFRVSFDWGARK